MPASGAGWQMGDAALGALDGKRCCRAAVPPVSEKSGEVRRRRRGRMPRKANKRRGRGCVLRCGVSPRPGGGSVDRVSKQAHQPRTSDRFRLIALLFQCGEHISSRPTTAGLGEFDGPMQGRFLGGRAHLSVPARVPSHARQRSGLPRVPDNRRTIEVQQGNRRCGKERSLRPICTPEGGVPANTRGIRARGWGTWREGTVSGIPLLSGRWCPLHP